MDGFSFQKKNLVKLSLSFIDFFNLSSGGLDFRDHSCITSAYFWTFLIHPLCHHKYSTDRMSAKIAIFRTNLPSPFAEVIKGWSLW